METGRAGQNTYYHSNQAYVSSGLPKSEFFWIDGHHYQPLNANFSTLASHSLLTFPLLTTPHLYSQDSISDCALSHHSQSSFPPMTCPPDQLPQDVNTPDDIAQTPSHFYNPQRPPVPTYIFGSSHLSNTSATTPEQHCSNPAQSVIGSSTMTSHYPICESFSHLSPTLSRSSSMNPGIDSYPPLTPDVMDEHRFSQSPSFSQGNEGVDESISAEPYASLIYRALKSAPEHKMVLREIYDWFEQNTDKGKDNGSKGWQNSIRHNLSMNGVSNFLLAYIKELHLWTIGI